jgi:hypothetical protein
MNNKAKIVKLEAEIKEREAEIDKLRGDKILICGFCYKSIEDHEEYPTQYCYPALQCWIYLNEWEHDKKYPKMWRMKKEFGKQPF